LIPSPCASGGELHYRVLWGRTPATAAALTAPSPAEARGWGRAWGGPGLVFGLAAGALTAGAIAATSPYYYGPGPYGYYYGPRVYYAPGPYAYYGGAYPYSPRYFGW
jgi:hypothetical protein